MQMTCGGDPTSVKEALARTDGPLWHEAIWAEIRALESLNCWRVRPRHKKESDPNEKHKKTFRSKVVMKTKPEALIAATVACCRLHAI